MGHSMDWRERIAVEPGKRSGKACVRGTRIAVADILSYLAAGETEASLLKEFPQLKAEDIRAALAYAADGERHTKLLAAE
jgi:uncharacterized protein (DUF433 family)